MKFDFLRSLLDSSQDLLAVIDLDGTIVECNAAFARSAGLTWEETLGKKVEQFVSSKQRRNFTGTLKGAFSTGLSSDLRANFKSRNGISIPISWIVSPKISPNGRAELIILKGLDTREFDQITSRLTEAENQFEGFMDSLPGIAFIKDKSRRLTYVNKRFEEVFECKVADGIGRKDESFLPRAVAHRNKVIEEGLLNSGGYDVRIEEDEAVLNDRRWMIHRFAIGEGSERKIGGLSLEITQLNEAEEMFRAMADASTDAISILRPKRDAGGKVIDFSFNYLNALAHHVFSIENYGLDSFKQATKAEFPASVKERCCLAAPGAMLTVPWFVRLLL